MSRATRSRTRTDRKPKAVTAARWAAWRTIYRTFTEDAWTDRAFAGEAERAQLDARDRAFGQRCAFGTVHQAKLLDHIIATVGKRPLRKLDPPVLAALRLGLFELRSGSGADNHAAVSQAVEIVRGTVGERAVAFANAVLRRAAVDADDIIAALDPDLVADQAVLLSMPEWLVQRMVDQHGPAGIAALRAQNTPTPNTSVRCNTVLATVEQIDAALASSGATVVEVDDPLSRALPASRMIQGSTSGLGELIEQGWVHPQGRASMLAAYAVDAQPGERILDMCAAPGGKTMVLAGQLCGQGSVTACDLHEHRAASISYLASRMGVAGLVTSRCADATTFASPDLFDRVLVDAPCSGVGVLRRRPDARWKLTEAQVDELAALQVQILTNAAKLVRPGGTVVYSTCTMLQEECEQVVAAVTDTHTSPPILIPDALPPIVPASMHLEGTQSMARIWPQDVDADGFFIARFTRPMTPGVSA